jgi:hypothetical protein
MSIEERRRVPPEEIANLHIQWERGPMILEDVRALPRSPLVIAEGSTVPPVDPGRALWLVRPGAQPNFPPARHLAEEIVERARAKGVPILTVDGSLEATIEAVENHFAQALLEGPRAETLEERRALVRKANEALVFQVRTGTARPWATETPESMTRDFLCECDDPECRAVVTIPVAEFERRAQAGPVTS